MTTLDDKDDKDNTALVLFDKSKQGIQTLQDPKPRQNVKPKPEPEEEPIKPELKPEDKKLQSFLLKVVIPTFGWSQQIFRTESTYVPSARTMLYCVEQVYFRLSGLRGFMNSTNGLACLLPEVQYYYSLAFYIRVMHIMRHLDLTNDDQNECLDRVLKSHPLNDWVIAEPMIPYFQCLAAFRPHDPRFGVVLPIIPHTTGATAARFGAISDELMILLPNMVTISKQIQRTRTYNIPDGGPHTEVQIYHYDLNDIDGNAMVNGAHNAAGINSWRRISLGVQQSNRSFPRTERQRKKVYEQTEWKRPFPNHGANAGVGNDANVDTWFHYLNFHLGFKHLSDIFEAGLAFQVPFKHNTTLDALPVFDGAYASVNHHYDNDGIAFANGNASRTQATPLLSMNCNNVTINEPIKDTNLGSMIGGITDLEMQLSCLTQTRVTFIDLYGPNSDRVGQFFAGHTLDSGQNTLTGHYFNPANIKTYGIIDEYDLQGALKSVLTSHLQGMKYMSSTK